MINKTTEHTAKALLNVSWILQTNCRSSHFFISSLYVVTVTKLKRLHFEAGDFENLIGLTKFELMHVYNILMVSICMFYSLNQLMENIKALFSVKLKVSQGLNYKLEVPDLCPFLFKAKKASSCPIRFWLSLSPALE